MFLSPELSVRQHANQSAVKKIKNIAQEIKIKIINKTNIPQSAHAWNQQTARAVLDIE